MSNFVEVLVRSRVWRSIFRHGLPLSNRTRAEAVFYNFFLHVHPTKVRKRSIKFTYTWGLGGLSAGLFIILTVSGALLMSYYRPSIHEAYWDMKDLQFVVSSRPVPAKYAPVGSSCDGRDSVSPYASCILYRFVSSSEGI